MLELLSEKRESVQRDKCLQREKCPTCFQTGHRETIERLEKYRDIVVSSADILSSDNLLMYDVPQNLQLRNVQSVRNAAARHIHVA